MYRNAKKYKKHRKKAILDKRFYIIPLICLFVGLFTGAILARGIEPDRLITIENAFAHSLESRQSFSELYVGNVIRNGGLMLIIWISTFIPFGYIAAGFILVIFAMSYGFTAVALFSAFSTEGFMYAVNLGLQGIILLAAAYFLCVSGFYYGNKFKAKQFSQNKHLLLTYFVILLIAETAVVLASMLA